LEKGDGYAWHGGRLEIGENALQDIQATDPDHRLDLAALNELEDDRCAFGDEHGVTKPFGLLLEILNRTKATLLTKEAKFVQRGRATLLVAQANREEEKPLIVGYGGQDILPCLVVDQDCGEIPGVFHARPLGHDVGVFPEFVERDGRSKVVVRHILGNFLLEPVTFKTGLGDIGLGLAPGAARDGCRSFYFEIGHVDAALGEGLGI
jgi:hypothetical protein